LNLLFELQIKSVVRDFGFGLSEVEALRLTSLITAGTSSAIFYLRSRKLNMLRQQGFAALGRRLSNVAWTIDVGAQ